MVMDIAAPRRQALLIEVALKADADDDANALGLIVNDSGAAR
jgi:hypothetical protein